ncbi:MAG: amino acid adenylation domain-containing protein [Hyphomicrobiaceae bacterium]|nr:amino acid adenylation domain-containing protein [Hyphomicrobiaceae bacterium]
MSESLVESLSSMENGFFANARRAPDAIALDFGDVRVPYGELAERARRVSATLAGLAPGGGDVGKWVGVWCGKTVAAYAGILGILHAGRGYVPIAETAPAGRIAECLSRAAAATLVVDQTTLAALDDLLALVDRPLDVVVLAGDEGALAMLAARHARHRFPVLAAAAPDRIETRVNRDEPAYLMFTSGSTGRPKGVVVTHANVRFFLDDVRRHYDFGPADRFTQFFDFTFDLSVFDIFVCLEAGGCLCPMSHQDRLFAARYMRRAKPTVWFSVPSFIHALKAARQLKPGAWPDLRWSLFCGEALTYGAARDWMAAAPNARTENLYGPTEVTIACTRFRIEPEVAAVADTAGIVPIGTAHPGHICRIVDPAGNAVDAGATGELLIAGPQVSLGYLDDPDEQRLRFVEPPESGLRFYRTGDLVRLDNATSGLCFVGRADTQVKIRGYRIELGEVEVALRRVFPGKRVVALAVERRPGWASLVAVIEQTHPGDEMAMPRLRQQLSNFLPDYMLPDEFAFVPSMPHNANGKIDRKALRAGLEDATPETGSAGSPGL